MPEKIQPSIQDMKEELAGLPPEELPLFVEKYAGDQRKGALRLVEQAEKRREAWDKEQKRLDGMLRYERQYRESCSLICGIDEVGRGPLAGPVVAAAVILPSDARIPYVNDSKKLSAAKRKELDREIRSRALAVGLGEIGPARIDEINILQATYEAMREAVGALGVQPELLLNDAVTIPGVEIPQVPIIHGDAKSQSIAAASIVAKVARDALMEEMDSRYPGYGFASNKGYGSAEHIEALGKLGPCSIHRRSFLTHFTGVNTRESGTWYETQAACELEKAGLTILERNFRCRTGEVDLIAAEGRTLVFCEVKFRSTPAAGEPEEAVSSQKQRRICSAAAFYLRTKKRPEDTPVRMDVVAISADTLRWHKNAFEWVL